MALRLAPNDHPTSTQTRRLPSCTIHRSSASAPTTRWPLLLCLKHCFFPSLLPSVPGRLQVICIRADDPLAAKLNDVEDVER